MRRRQRRRRRSYDLGGSMNGRIWEMDWMTIQAEEGDGEKGINGPRNELFDEL